MNWRICIAALVAFGAQISPVAAAAQGFDLQSVLPAGDASVAGRILQMMVLITVLSVAPGILMMVTSFTRFAIALSFLRAGLGLQTTPSNLVLVSLALFLTIFVMAPTFDAAWKNGVQPMIENKISMENGYTQTTAPFRSFMLANVRPKDLATFKAMSASRFGVEAGLPDEDLRVLVPSFMISELRRGFEIGFLIVLPFLVIDLVVSTVLMAMGMMMLPPTVLSMPLKVLFFVLIDGWGLLVGTLAKSYI